MALSVPGGLPSGSLETGQKTDGEEDLALLFSVTHWVGFSSGRIWHNNGNVLYEVNVQ